MTCIPALAVVVIYKMAGERKMPCDRAYMEGYFLLGVKRNRKTGGGGETILF